MDIEFEIKIRVSDAGKKEEAKISVSGDISKIGKLLGEIIGPYLNGGEKG